jgi:hypothetical protein
VTGIAEAASGPVDLVGPLAFDAGPSVDIPVAEFDAGRRCVLCAGPVSRYTTPGPQGAAVCSRCEDERVLGDATGWEWCVMSSRYVRIPGDAAAAARGRFAALVDSPAADRSTRTCHRCQEDLPVSAFRMQASGRRLRRTCERCASARTRRLRAGRGGGRMCGACDAETLAGWQRPRCPDCLWVTRLRADLVKLTRANRREARRAERLAHPRRDRRMVGPPSPHAQRRRRLRELLAAGLRECSVCGGVKPLDAFSPARPGNLATRCRECDRERARERYRRLKQEAAR